MMLAIDFIKSLEYEELNEIQDKAYDAYDKPYADVEDAENAYARAFQEGLEKLLNKREAGA